MAKRVLCARKRCRAELEEVPPIAVGSNIVVEMPSALAQVGTASVPTYGLRATGFNLLRRQIFAFAFHVAVNQTRLLLFLSMVACKVTAPSARRVNRIASPVLRRNASRIAFGIVTWPLADIFILGKRCDTSARACETYRPRTISPKSERL